MSLLAIIAMVLAIIAAVWVVMEHPSPPRPWPLLLVAIAVILLALSGTFDLTID